MNSPRHRLPLLPGRGLLLLAAALAGCAAWDNGQPLTRDTERTRDRRVCLMQPPAQIEACLRRVEEDYVARQGMRQVEKPARDSGEEPVEEVVPAR